MNEMVLSGEERSRVLRNTYWLLAISMIPTIFGAWTGIKLFNLTQLWSGNPLIAFMVLMGVGIAFIIAINAAKNTSLGVPILLAFTFFMGMVISPTVGRVLGMANGASLVALAAGGTAMIFAAMATMASTMKKDISNWGKFLTIGLVALIVVMIANIFLQLAFLAVLLSAIAIVLFSAFLLYDLKRVIDGGETNYITATLAVYLDLVNIFQNLLSLLGITAGRED